MTTTQTASLPTVATQNDHFRHHPGPDWRVTAAVHAKGPIFVFAVVSTVRAFDAFVADNDPHGEHDFGAFDLGGERIIWKIDYYDKDLSYGSPDPADPTVTRRVLTIMLAADY